MKSAKRLFTIFLVAVMVLSLAPAAFAANSKDIAIGKDGGTIRVSGFNEEGTITYEYDLETKGTFPIFYASGPVTLDYNLTLEATTTDFITLHPDAYLDGAGEVIVPMGGECKDIPFSDDGFVTLTEEGIYDDWILFSTGDGTTDVAVIFIVIGDGKAPEIAAPNVSVTPTSSKVMVNGESKTFDAYNINGNNFFKLRDLAYVLNGSEKQFAVAWDGENNKIVLTSGQSYLPVGGEMSTGANANSGTSTTASVYLNGKKIDLTAYNISDNNYFKLRDIGNAFNFGVIWDGTSNTISIDTSKGYTPEH